MESSHGSVANFVNISNEEIERDDLFLGKKDSIICASIPENPTMLNGKWKLLSRAYQFMRTNKNLLNNDKWADRFSTRGSECFKELKDKEIIECLNEDSKRGRFYKLTSNPKPFRLRQSAALSLSNTICQSRPEAD